MGRRIAFRDTVYFDELAEFADQAGWQQETPGGQPVQGTEPHQVESWHFRWRAPAGPVEFVDDEAIECQLLDIDADAAESVEPAVRDAFAMLDAAEAAQDYLTAEDPEQRENLLRIIGGVVDRDTEDELVAGAVADGLHDTDPMTRLAAIVAAGAAHWPRFRERLQALAEHDPDPNLRLIARNALDGHP